MLRCLDILSYWCPGSDFQFSASFRLFRSCCLPSLLAAFPFWRKNHLALSICNSPRRRPSVLQLSSPNSLARSLAKLQTLRRRCAAVGILHIRAPCLSLSPPPSLSSSLYHTLNISCAIPFLHFIGQCIMQVGRSMS